VARTWQSFLRVAIIGYLFGGRSILIHKKIMRVPRTPLSRDFGTTLIEQSAKPEGGSAQMLCEAQGITWEITLPLPSVSSSDALGVPKWHRPTRRIQRKAPPPGPH
jgi:hypothetical protein